MYNRRYSPLLAVAPLRSIRHMGFPHGNALLYQTPNIRATDYHTSKKLFTFNTKYI